MVCSQGHTYQAQCVTQCNSGFTHSGTTAITCAASGHWTASAPCIGELKSTTFLCHFIFVYSSVQDCLQYSFTCLCMPVPERVLRQLVSFMSDCKCCGFHVFFVLLLSSFFVAVVVDRNFLQDCADRSSLSAVVPFSIIFDVPYCHIHDLRMIFLQYLELNCFDQRVRLFTTFSVWSYDGPHQADGLLHMIVCCSFSGITALPE